MKTWSITARQIPGHDFKVSMQNRKLFLVCHCATIIRFAHAQIVQVYGNYQIVMLPPPKSLLPAKSPQCCANQLHATCSPFVSPPSFPSGFEMSQFQHFELRLFFPLVPERLRTTPSGMAPGSCWELTTYA
jgi:hypothetical protein